ncbi:jumonji domain-containing protein 6, partial [Nowakowskiella sp. JEL0078]
MMRKRDHDTVSPPNERMSSKSAPSDSDSEVETKRRKKNSLNFLALVCSPEVENEKISLAKKARKNVKCLIPQPPNTEALNNTPNVIKCTKRSARSEIGIRGWISLNYRFSNPAFSFTPDPESVSHIAHHTFWPSSDADTVPRIDYAKTTTTEFIKAFEQPAIPVVITGATDSWPAHANWKPSNLLEKYPSEKFKVGEDDDGDSVYLSLAHYFYYALAPGKPKKSQPRSLSKSASFARSVIADARYDDSPLYIFDSRFGERTKGNSGGLGLPSCATKELLEDYVVPKYFRDDLFRLVGDRRRPPYRWVVIGPARSGTGIHVDPLGTSAWNSLIFGHKRWVLFPPRVPKHLVDPRGLTDHEAATWFAEAYPQIVHSSTKDVSGKTLAERLGMIELLQKPGETVFVPGGWHHVVMNLDFAVAVTQNVMTRTNFEFVYLKTRFSRPKLAVKLISQLKKLAEGTNFADLVENKYLYPTWDVVDNDNWDITKLPASYFRKFLNSIQAQTAAAVVVVARIVIAVIQIVIVVVDNQIAV